LQGFKGKKNGDLSASCEYLVIDKITSAYLQ